MDISIGSEMDDFFHFLYPDYIRDCRDNHLLQRSDKTEAGNKGGKGAPILQ